MWCFVVNFNDFYTSVYNTGRIMVYQCPTVRPSVCPFHMSCSNLRTPWPIHFKFHRVIGIDGLTVCILYGEISIFHSRVMGLYSSNCRRFFVCRAVNWEPLGQFTSSFAQLLELIVLWSCILFGEISIFHSRVMGKKVFTNIVWMLTTGVSCALGAAVYSFILFLLINFLGPGWLNELGRWI